MQKNLVLKIAAVVSGISGLVIIFSTIYPILEYNSISDEKFPDLISPLPQEESVGTNGNKEYDYTRASNWFVGGAERDDFKTTKVAYYTISIPKLRIEDATVAIGGEDLSESLIQYPGTALPGGIGNAVIFGHSILPSFYDPEDYLAIFSTLPTLDKGDEVIVHYDGVRYIFQVEDMFEVSPTDIQVLDQNQSRSYLTLVTCTPPGDPRKPKRLIVRAKIAPPNTANANIRN